MSEQERLAALEQRLDQMEANNCYRVITPSPETKALGIIGNVAGGALVVCVAVRVVKSFMS